METITKEINIYKYNELNEEAQNKVINDYIRFMLDTIDYENLNKNSNLYKAINKCEKMQTPWFIEQYVWDYCNKHILKEVKKDEYYENGDVYYE